MGLAQIRLMPPPDTAQRRDYDFAHYQDHLAIVQAIFAAGGPTLPLHQIWPVIDFALFLQNHHQLHIDMNKAQALPDTDLTMLNQTFDADRLDWGWRNYQQHLAVHRALRLN